MAGADVTDCGCENASHLRHDDVLIPQGVNHSLTWPVLDVSGDPLDWTGWSARAQARASDQPGAVLRETWSSAPDAGEGTITLTGDGLSLLFTPTMTNAWTWPRADFDILLTSPSAELYRLTQGEMKLSRRITQ